ncbi:hypothetical protein [Candidatus Solincola tengchongensis]|uniref:hypothetical protein n=1 Tax=Candidatus Solincola tengchongensis TaxID=2900693 RepID=UPI00257C6163|nr:hypothetical protein [Candidatus Solincola tengchongensis]
MRKVFFSVIGIISSVMALAVGSHLFLRESQACSFRYRPLFDLELRDQDESWSDGVSDTWTIMEMEPGKEYQFSKSFIQMRNLGIVRSDHLEIGVNYSLTGYPGENAPVTAEEMAGMIILTALGYGSDSWRIDLLTGEITGMPPRPYGYRPGDWRVEDTDGDGKITFRDLKDDPLDDLPPPQFWMDERKCPTMRMSVRFADEADNRFMGVALNVSFVYTLNQCSRQ